LANDPRQPPSTFHELQLLLATYASLLHVLFGQRCDHSQKVWNIYGILKDLDVEEKRQDFTSTLCRQIVWAILDDGRVFFNKRLHPDRFQLPVSQILFPTLVLEAIYPNVHWQEPINRNIPMQWMTQGAVQDWHRDDAPRDLRTGFSGVPVAFSLPTHPQMQHLAGGAGVGYQQSVVVPPPPPAPPGPLPKFPPARQGVDDRLGQVHPVLKLHLEEYHHAFRGSMMFSKILQAANLQWTDLPTLPGFVDDRGRNMICFSHICGPCTFRPCRLRKGHVPKEQIPTDWTLWKKIELGSAITSKRRLPSLVWEARQRDSECDSGGARDRYLLRY
jgi:hypothetical protein